MPMPIIVVTIIVIFFYFLGKEMLPKEMLPKEKSINKAKEISKLNEKYVDFPKIEKQESDLIKIYESQTPKYDRITMDYANVSKYEFELYERKIEDYGFYKETDVRYDKNNTYVILEYNEERQQLHVVFHIKAF